MQATAGSGAVRIGRIALLVTVIGLAFLSGSRTGFGGVVAGVSVTLFVRHPSRYLAGAATLGAVAAIATLAGGDVELDEGATGNLIRGQSISRLSGRLDRWATGLEMWRESPILGKGFMTSRKLQFVETREDGLDREDSGPTRRARASISTASTSRRSSISAWWATCCCSRSASRCFGAPAGSRARPTRRRRRSARRTSER